MPAYVKNEEGLIAFAGEAPENARRLHTGFGGETRTLEQERRFIARLAETDGRGRLLVPGMASAAGPEESTDIPDAAGAQ